MKTYKLLSVLMVSSMIFMSGCNKPSDNVSGTVTSSKKESGKKEEEVKEVEEAKTSIEELNEIVGCKLKRINEEDAGEKYKIITKGDLTIAEYDFTSNGIRYRVRAGKTREDLFGFIYGDYTIGEQADFLHADNTMIENKGEFIWSRWYVGDMQYNMFETNSDCTKDIMRNTQNLICENS